ncbi:MAG: hypothetical protein HC842_02570 [Cytophagales bacterium]|nr:hypothetical protein [Cytophagales bacterium]
MRTGQRTRLPLMVLLVSTFATAQAQNAEKLARKAEQYFRIRNYTEAAKIYQEAIEAGDKNPLTYYNAAISYLAMPNLNQQVKAVDLLEKAAELGVEALPKDFYKTQAEAFHKDEQVADAIAALEKYQKKIDPKDKAEQDWAKARMELYERARYYIEQATPTEIERIGTPISSEYTEYNPVVSADESVMAYTALRPTGQSSKPFVEEIYITYRNKESNKWSEPVHIKINTTNNVGTAGISPDGQNMLIFISEGQSGGNLYTMKKDGGNWDFPVSLGNEINSTYLESTASITPDGRTIYFASNRPGTYGGLDIWKVTKSDKGTWGKPENLGPNVNSRFDEDAPFIHPDQRTLFFTSDGHSTMGGKDIFKTTFIGGEWLTPKNMGYPINTTANDNYFNLTADGKKGFFSSDRKGGLGGQDIYTLLMPEEAANIPLTMIKGRILAEQPGSEPAPVATEIKVVDNETSEKVQFVYNPNKLTGNYLIIFPPGKNYDMIIESQGFMPYTLNINIPNQTYFYELYQEIILKSIKQFDVLVGQEVSVKNVFYDTKRKAEADAKMANEAMLVKNDSVDVFEMMDAIIASQDSTAYEYLLDLMFKVNPIDSVNFDNLEDEKTEQAVRTYYFDESDTTKLIARQIGDEVVFSLPTFFVSDESEKAKEKAKEAAVKRYDPELLKWSFKIYFDVGKNQIKEKYFDELKKYHEQMEKTRNWGLKYRAMPHPKVIRKKTAS